MRKVSLLIGICMLAALAITLWAQQAPTDLSPVMKDVGATTNKLRMDIMAGNAADVTADAEGDWKIFSLRVEYGVDVREEIFRLASQRHWSVRELSQRRATLEDVFVELTHPDQA